MTSPSPEIAPFLRAHLEWEWTGARRTLSSWVGMGLSPPLLALALLALMTVVQTTTSPRLVEEATVALDGPEEAVQAVRRAIRNPLLRVVGPDAPDATIRATLPSLDMELSTLDARAYPSFSASDDRHADYAKREVQEAWAYWVASQTLGAAPSVEVVDASGAAVSRIDTAWPTQGLVGTILSSAGLPDLKRLASLSGWMVFWLVGPWTFGVSYPALVEAQVLRHRRDGPYTPMVLGMPHRHLAVADVASMVIASTFLATLASVTWVAGVAVMSAWVGEPWAMSAPQALAATIGLVALNVPQSAALGAVLSRASERLPAILGMVLVFVGFAVISWASHTQWLSLLRMASHLPIVGPCSLWWSLVEGTWSWPALGVQCLWTIVLPLLTMPLFRWTGSTRVLWRRS